MSEPHVQIHVDINNEDIQVMLAIKEDLSEYGQQAGRLVDKLLEGVHAANTVAQLTAKGVKVPLYAVHPEGETE